MGVYDQFNWHQILKNMPLCFTSRHSDIRQARGSQSGAWKATLIDLPRNRREDPRETGHATVSSRFIEVFTSISILDLDTEIFPLHIRMTTKFYDAYTFGLWSSTR